MDKNSSKKISLSNALEDAFRDAFPGGNKYLRQLTHGVGLKRSGEDIAALYSTDLLEHNQLEIALDPASLGRGSSEIVAASLWLRHQKILPGRGESKNHKRGEPVNWFRIGFNSENELIAFLADLRQQQDPLRMSNQKWVVPMDVPSEIESVEPDSRLWIYGKPTWQLSLDAVEALGGRATKSDIEQFIVQQVPNFNKANIAPDLNLLSVNSNSRANYSVNKRPRRTDQGNVYDALYMDRQADKTDFVLYDKDKHGVWELVALDSDTKLRPRLINDVKLANEIATATATADGAHDFDPTDETDAREKVIATIVRRRGQKKFRDQLLKAYESRCAITGCDFEDALEAAHIRSYLADHTNVVSNGLLLRADIHTLFDLGLIRIHPETMQVVLASRLMESEYRMFSGVKIRLPKNKLWWPNLEALTLQGKGSLAY